ncbi:MAG: hypothetical protein R3E89_10630 [Thiolinea sp.]
MQAQDVFVLYLADTAWWWMGAYHFVPQDVVYENDDAIRDGALGEEKLRDWLALVEASKRLMVIDSAMPDRRSPASPHGSRYARHG